MNTDINLKKINIKELVLKYYQRYSRHAVFAVILVVLLVYLGVVFRISGLARAEPDSSQQAASSSIPKIDNKAIQAIQSLENNNTDIHALFENARKNPFQE